MCQIAVEWPFDHLLPSQMRKVASLSAQPLSLCFNPRGHGSLSAVDIGEHCEHDGSLWTPYLNPSTICAPFETRSTGASSVEPTRSLSWPTPCSPPPARFLRRST